MARLIGKEQLASWAKAVAALHRPATVDWAARFGLDRGGAVAPIAPPAVPVQGAAATPWLVKYDGPCADCGQILPKGTEAVWNQSQRKMFCLECARHI